VKAYVCHELTGFDGLTYEDMPSFKPDPGEVRIEVRACGINFADRLIIAGKYQFKPLLPFILGGEVAGTILELGDGVDIWQVGDRVMVWPKKSAGYPWRKWGNAFGDPAAVANRIRRRGSTSTRHFCTFSMTIR
jgi:NADPH:quinone reductase-like Zn-dependent oxidoreductase